jgi:ubiquinone/menaquinone biosynthesis C-methylase UbiE
VNERGPDRGTESFYKIDRVAADYETIRFENPGGRLVDALQKNAVLEGVDSLNLTGKKVLDVACGTGRFSRLFRSRGARVIGLDLSRAMLNQARDRQSADFYVEASALQLPFKEGIFDISVSVNAFNHLPAFEEAINEICRVSKRVILGLPHRNSLLLLAYAYRMLRGWGYRYTRHKATRYRGAPLIYTLYFSTKELENIFKKNHFEVIGCPKCRVFPFPYVPGSLIKAVEILEKVVVRCLSRFGTFMAMVAERRRTRD